MWINSITNKVYKSYTEIEQELKQVSLPSTISNEDLVPFNIFPLLLKPIPNYNPLYKKLVESVPSYINGEYFCEWDVVDLSEEEQVQAKEQFVNMVVQNIQNKLDQFALTRNYSSILSACTYATDPNPKFASEGQYCVNKRSETWAALYTILAEVESGQRPIPTSYEEVENLLPVLEWPV